LILFNAVEGTERDAIAAKAKELAAALKPTSKERRLLDAAVLLATAGPQRAYQTLADASGKRDRDLEFWTAELAYRARDYENARKGYQALLEGDAPTFRGRIYDHYSAVLLYFDDPERAVEVGKLYADGFPGEADAVGVYATTLAAAGRFDEALDKAKKAVELNEGEDTIAGLAKVHAYRGELKEARKLYRRSAAMAGDSRRPIRNAALAMLHLVEGETDQAAAAVAECLPGGDDDSIKQRGPCLFAAGLASPDRIDDIIAELEKLAGAGTALDPPYGFPLALANLLRARQIAFGGACLYAPDTDRPAPLSAALIDEAAKLLRGSRDFFAAYHLPFFGWYSACELANLGRAAGRPDLLEALEVTGNVAPGRGPALLTLAEFAPNDAKRDALLARFEAEWPSVDSSQLRARAAAARQAP
jgi:tetratricopeptide (TPR) repeat protein